MADEKDGGNPPAQTPAPSDEIKNMKAEFGRKLENTNQQLAQVLEALKAQTAPKAPQKAEADGEGDLSEMIYSDPNKFVNKLTEKVSAAVDKKLSSAQAATTKYQQVVGSIISEFPEAGDQSSELTKRANELFLALPAEDRDNPLALKTSVTAAAAELGIKPKSKRPKVSDDDGFSLGGGGGGARERKTAQKEIDRNTELFAEAVGLDLNDPKNKEAKERIKNGHGRKSYEKWSKI